LSARGAGLSKREKELVKLIAELGSVKLAVTRMGISKLRAYQMLSSIRKKRWAWRMSENFLLNMEKREPLLKRLCIPLAQPVGPRRSESMSESKTSDLGYSYAEDVKKNSRQKNYRGLESLSDESNIS